MKLLVTGAGGFLGRAVVAAAVRAGHEVVALHRATSRPSDDPVPEGVTLLTGDLRQPGPWSGALGAVEAVVHCAAAASGDLPTQLAGTVLATENLLTALPASLRRFVHVSSFSVYDFDAPRWPGHLDEEVPLEADPLRRDAYTQTKLMQERMVRDHARDRGLPLIVVRPGAIYGPGKEWDFGRSLRLGRFDLIFAPFSAMRLIHVENCADAIVAALTAPVERELIINLVDAEQPGHWRFHHHARRTGAPVGLGVPVPYWMVLGLGVAARLASQLFFAGRARLPEMLDLPRQRVRWRPLRYSNDRARTALGWQQRIGLAEGIETLVD